MIDTINVTSLVIGIVALLLTIYYGARARKAYHLLMSNFDQKVRDILTDVLEQEGLSSAEQVRGLVKNISAEYAISMPTDEYITRILRRIALNYERNGEDRRKLANLEQMRRAIEPHGPPLMSIASINRLAAFQIIMIAAIVFLIIYRFLYLYNSNSNLMLYIVIMVLQILIVIVMYTVNYYSNKLLAQKRK
jgi:hypothetical protein